MLNAKKCSNIHIIVIFNHSLILRETESRMIFSDCYQIMNIVLSVAFFFSLSKYCKPQFLSFIMLDTHLTVQEHVGHGR